MDAPARPARSVSSREREKFRHAIRKNITNQFSDVCMTRVPIGVLDLGVNYLQCFSVRLRRALEHLVGQERASNSLQEVELAVKADLSLSLDTSEQTPAPAAAPAPAPAVSSPLSSSFPPPPGTTATAGTVTGTAVAAAGIDGSLPKNSSATAGGSGKGSDNRSTPNDGTSATKAATTGAGGGAGSGGGGGRGGDYRLPDGRLGRLLGNERLAHEILVNPDFQVFFL